MFQFGSPNIDKLKTKGNIKGLIKAMSYIKDPKICRDAAKALGEIGDSSVVEPLIQIIFAKGGVRKSLGTEAIRSLGKLGDSRAVNPLIRIVKMTDSSELRLEAIENLGKLGDTRAVEPLLSSLTSSNSNVKTAAEKALKEIGNPAVDLLIENLLNSERSIRIQAARMLHKLSWIPSNDSEKASFWIADRNLNNLLEFGYHNFKPFINKSLKWENHPDDFPFYVQLARFILKTESNADDPVISLAKSLLENSISNALNKKLASRQAYEDYPKFISKSDKLMFGDYADIIRAVVSCTKVVTHSWDVYEDYGFNTDRSISTLKHLCEINTPVSSNLLLHFTKLKDLIVETTNKSPTFGDYPTTTVSFESQRNIAKAELARRGNPNYKHSHYITEDNWKIK